MPELAIVSGRDSFGDPVVMTSPDMVTWTPVASWPGADAGRVNVAGETYFVQTGASGAPNNYAWSNDGVTWSLASFPTSLARVVWTGTEFVAANVGARTSANPAGPWSDPATLLGTTINVRDMLHRNGVIVAAGAGSSQPPIAFSTDGGATWGTYSPTDLTRGAQGLAHGSGRWVAVRSSVAGLTSDAVLASTSGTSWTTENTGIPDRTWHDIAYGNGIFVAIGAVGSLPPGNPRVMISTDGVSWTGSTPTGSPVFNAGSMITHWRGLFAVVTGVESEIWTSTDGVNWSAQDFPGHTWGNIAAGLARARGGWYVGRPIG